MNSIQNIHNKIQQYVDQIISEKEISSNEKYQMICELQEYLEEEPMMKQHIIDNILNQVHQWLQESFNQNQTNPLKTFGELYTKFGKIHHSLENSFFILNERQRIRTIESFTTKLEDVWNNFFEEQVKKYHLKESLFEWLKNVFESEIVPSHEFVSFCNILYSTQHRFIVSEVIEMIDNQISTIFNSYVLSNGHHQNERYSSQVYSFYVDSMEKFIAIEMNYYSSLSEIILINLFNNEMEKILEDLEYYWKENDIHSVSKILGLINSTKLSKKTIQRITEKSVELCKQNIRKKIERIKEVTIEDFIQICDECFILKSYEQTIQYSSITLTMILSSWNLYVKNEQNIMIDFIKLISQTIDSGDKDELDKKIDILKALYSLETFSIIYQKSLYTKIINKRIKNMEMELYFMNHFKHLVDRNTSTNLISMIRDYKQTGFYANMITFPTNVNFTFSTIVLTKIATDVSLNCSLQMPSFMNSIISQFESHFKEINHSKRFLFIPHHSYCLVSYSKENSEGKPMKIMLYLNTIQYVLLNQFNDKKKIPVEELQKVSSNKNVIKEMINLLIGNEILLKNDNCIELNDALQVSEKKVINCLYSSKVEERKNKSNTVNVEEDLELYKSNKTLCTLMRLMKRKQQMFIPTLLEEVTKELSSYFIVDQKYIKNKMEILLQKELLERSPEDSNIVLYGN